MAYVEAHASLRNHPKTKRAAKMLGIRSVYMVGHLLHMWWWCQDYAADGNLASYTIDEIAEAADWIEEPERFIDALLECGGQDEAGFLEEHDGALFVHDWEQYGGKLFVKRAQGAKRQATWRARQAAARNDDVTPDVTVSNALLTRHVTQSNAHRKEEIREEEIREEETDARDDTAWRRAIGSFESEIGLVSGSITPDMLDMWQVLESNGTTGWWDGAIAVAVASNKRSWGYVRGILSRCMAEGRPPMINKNGNGKPAEAGPFKE